MTNIKPCRECANFYNADGSIRETPGIRLPEDPCRECAEGDNIFHNATIKWSHYKRFWHVQMDPILASIWESVFKTFRPGARSYKMDRRATHIYRLEVKVLKSAAWKRMKAKVDIGTATKDDPAPRIVKIVRLRNASATAGEYLEVDTDVAQWADRNLIGTIAHEMIHYWLHDTGAYHGNRSLDLRKGRNGGTDCHGRLFRECCQAYGIQGHMSEMLYRYKYACPCGWWIKSQKPIKQQRCGSCHRILVSPTEYKRLQKVAAIGARSLTIKIEGYVPMKVKRLT